MTLDLLLASSRRRLETQIVTQTSTRSIASKRQHLAHHSDGRRVADAAVRMMSETAHDLRSPLTAIRESMRIVSDGDLGELASGQQACLASAIEQCDCMDQMIGEMVQLERLRTGLPRVQRRIVPISLIRTAIDETLRPWALPRQISVLWGGPVDMGTEVYADPSMLRRLVVNLVTNAIRVTSEGGSILIRLARTRDPQSIRWSVMDQGAGISESDMLRIANQETMLGGGEGLGLSICRQLAALHFSSLWISSSRGAGTEVSFQTSIAGPRSVAESWARWRVAQRDRLSSRRRPGQADSSPTAQMVQSTTSDPRAVTVELSHDAADPRCESKIAVGIVSVGATVSREASDAFDELFQAQLQMFDFGYRIGVRQWVWGFDIDASGVQDRIDSIVNATQTRISGVRFDWSKPQMIPIDARRTLSRLSDLLIRLSLSAAVSSHVVDNDQVRLGTVPIICTDTACARLDEELRRLNRRFQRRTRRMQESGKIRSRR